LPRAKWTDYTRQHLRALWWQGLDPAAIAIILKPEVGTLCNPVGIKAQANFIGAQRSPTVISKARQNARLGKGKFTAGVANPACQIHSKAPYLGLATLGPDPFREIKLAQILRSNRGRL
jgi:hypothetical protein